MRYISLFPSDYTPALEKFIKRQVGNMIDDQFTHALVAPSPEDIKCLVPKGADSSPVSRMSQFSVAKSLLRRVSVSGYGSEEQGLTILRALLNDPLRDLPAAINLHVHLIRHVEGDDDPKDAEDNDASASLFSLADPVATLDDLILPETLKERILRNLLVIKHQRTLHDEWGLKDIAGFRNRMSVSLNFIGPSGTGKTLAAEAVAHELGKPFMVVDYSGLESKYVGDTSKNIKAAFEAAAKHDALLFFDEADSFLGRRIEEVRQSYDTAVNNTRSVMLMELSRFRGVIIFATNLVTNYDPAFRRRILDHIEFPFPDLGARRVILERHTPGGIPGREGLNFSLLASKSDGLSGSDLANVAYKACVMLLGRIDRRTLPATIADEDYLVAIDEVKRGSSLIKDFKLEELSEEDFEEVP